LEKIAGSREERGRLDPVALLLPGSISGFWSKESTSPERVDTRMGPEELGGHAGGSGAASKLSGAAGSVRGRERGGNGALGFAGNGEGIAAEVI
jgi:hypothetical protein